MNGSGVIFDEFQDAQPNTRGLISDGGTILAAVLVFVGYYVGAKIGFALTFKPVPVSVLWPPNSILLAALLLRPRRTWWVLLLAVFPAHWLVQLQSNVPPRMIFCWFVSNSVEALIGATSIRFLVSRGLLFNNLRDVTIFCFCGAFLGPFLSSFLDTNFVRWNEWGTGSYFEIWRIRFTSNVLAALIVTPLVLTWANSGLGSLKKAPGRRWWEAALLFLGLFSISFTVLYKLGRDADPGLLFLPLPFLFWAAVRFGRCGSATAVFTLAFLSVWAVAHGHGPFSGGSPERSAFAIQVFLIVLSMTLLLLAAVIEERSETEETLREREERISLAAETANLALWTIDDERRESWMSDKGRELFGFATNERLSREVFLSRVHPEDRQRVEDAIERARAEHRTFEIEYRLSRPDGETRWLIARGRYLRSDRDRVGELIGVALDVTGQVRADLELDMQREEMTRLSRVAMMGELTASLAHELNQPLAAIASNAAAAKRFLASGLFDPKMFEEILTDVFADARRAGEVIHGIHHLVRKREGTRCALNLNDLIREVLRLLHSDLLGRGATVETKLALNLSTVQADPIHLQQVLLNLIMNSLEAMHEMPTNERRLLIATETLGGFVQVTLRDHGVGLPREDPDKIFTHFFSTKPDGMGMGLTIVRSILEAHGGELGAQNLEDGAQFFFRLPAS